MKERRDFDARLEEWLSSEATGRAPDRMFEHVFATTSTTRQVRALPGRATVLSEVPLFARLLLAAAVVLALVVGAVVGAPRLFNPQPPSRPPAELRLLPGSVLAGTCPHPANLVLLGSALWIVCPDQVRRIDAQTGQVTGAMSASGFAADASQVWIVQGDSVSSLDAATLVERRSLAVPGASAIALDPTSAWVVAAVDHRLLRLNRGSLAATSSISVDGAPGTVAVAAGSVWVTLPDRGIVIRIDPTTGRITASIPVANPATITGNAARIWVLDRSATTISQIDPATNVVRQRAFIPSAGGSAASLPPGGSGPPGGLAIDGSSVWEVAGTDATETDATSGEVLRSIRLSEPGDVALTGAAVVGRRLMLLDGLSDRVLVVTP